MQITAAGTYDWPAIWAIAQPIIAAGETFAYDPGMTEHEARDAWLLGPPGRTVIAVADDGTVLGTAAMHPNHGGPGAHIASASFMVAREHEGHGVGRAMVNHAVSWARETDHRGMLFNAVAASNIRAVGLYRSAGFEILATVPDGFLHPAEGYVGLHIMYRPL